MIGACDEGDDGTQPAGEARSEESGGIDTKGEPVTPPFAVDGDVEGLLLVWFDEQGPHSATSRSEVPPEHRGQVRVDSLTLPPERRLGPEWVYVADLRAPDKDGSYPVRKLRRAAFDAIVDAARGTKPSGEARARGAAPGEADVVIYGASWCGACDQAARFFEKKGVPFVEKDVEKNAAALSEMQRKAARAGVEPSGIPLIDYKGTLVQGFNQRALEQLIERGARPI
jgi:glutaredoxin